MAAVGFDDHAFPHPKLMWFSAGKANNEAPLGVWKTAISPQVGHVQVTSVRLPCYSCWWVQIRFFPSILVLVLVKIGAGGF